MDDTPQAKKSLGQHWLHDSASLEAMVEAAGVTENDVVLEIGPGSGTLSEHLVQRQAEVIAVEFDVSLIPALQAKFKTLPNSRFQVEAGDIRTYDFGALPEKYKIVANLPYYLTANLLRRLTEVSTPKPVRAALLVQKEVAERVAAKPGNMAFMSVAVQYYYEVSLGAPVPAELFSPPPKVDSQILSLQLRFQSLFPDVDIKRFFHLVKAGFAQRRKTLLNSLSSGLSLPRETVQQLCEQAAIDPQRRAQTLSLNEWYSLYQAL